MNNLIRRQSNFVDNFMNSFFNDDIFTLSKVKKYISSVPSLKVLKSNLKFEDNIYTFELSLPGIPKENVSIKVDAGVLTIDAKYEQKEESREGYLYKSFKRQSFLEEIKLPSDAIVDEIDAEIKDGILTLKIPTIKEEKETTKTIEIK